MSFLPFVGFVGRKFQSHDLKTFEKYFDLIVTKSIHVYGKVSTDCIVKVAEGEKEGEGVGWIVQSNLSSEKPRLCVV